MNVRDLFDLAGRVALVTGGARNLGWEIARGLAEAGAEVALTSRSLEDARKGARVLSDDTGRRAAGFACDVRLEDRVESTVRAVLAAFGRIDILVNNAGNVASTPETNPIEKRPLSEWEETVAVNLRGAFLCSKHVIRLAMRPERRGAIVHVASTAGMVGKDRRIYRGTSMGGVTVDYAAAKGGVLALTREMACALAADGIRVNAVSPGGFRRGHDETFARQYGELVPMGRMGREDRELKGAVVFLASEAASYITGVNLPVDGGLTAW
jgi:gluconate 5-dehydrogenase